MTENTSRLLDAAMILAQSYLAHNQIESKDLPALLKTCHEAVSNAAAPAEQPVEAVAMTREAAGARPSFAISISVPTRPATASASASRPSTP